MFTHIRPIPLSIPPTLPRYYYIPRYIFLLDTTLQVVTLSRSKQKKKRLHSQKKKKSNKKWQTVCSTLLCTFPVKREPGVFFKK